VSLRSLSPSSTTEAAKRGGLPLRGRHMSESSDQREDVSGAWGDPLLVLLAHCLSTRSLWEGFSESVLLSYLVSAKSQ
jgi:hypothetical protein